MCSGACQLTWCVQHHCEGDPIKILTTDTVKDINRKEWNLLVGSDRIDGLYNWYKTLEDSGMRKMHFVQVEENSTLKAAACCQIRTHYVRVVDVRPFYVTTPEETFALLKGLKYIQERENAAGSFFFSSSAARYNLVNHTLKGCTDFPVKENTFLDITFEDFDTYLKSLSRGTRRSVKNTLNRAERWDITSVFTNDFCAWKEAARTLQFSLCKEHDDFSAYVPEQFYDVLEKNLKEYAELVIILRKDTPLAFALVLNSSTTALYKLAGLDPRYKKYHSYFLIYYEGIKRAIERGQHRIYFGPSNYEFKEKIGCKREPCFALANMENPLLNAALRLYVKGYRILGKKF